VELNLTDFLFRYEESSYSTAPKVQLRPIGCRAWFISKI